MEFAEFETNNGKPEEVKPCCTDLVHVPKDPDSHLGAVENLTVYDDWSKIDDFHGCSAVAGRTVR